MKINEFKKKKFFDIQAAFGVIFMERKNDTEQFFFFLRSCTFGVWNP